LPNPEDHLETDRALATVGVSVALIYLSSNLIVGTLMPIVGTSKMLTSLPSSFATALILSFCIARTRRVETVLLAGSVLGLLYGVLFPGIIPLLPTYAACGLLGSAWLLLFSRKGRVAPTLPAILGACVLFRVGVVIIRKVWLTGLFEATGEVLVWTVIALEVMLTAIGATLGAAYGYQLIQRGVHQGYRASAGHPAPEPGKREKRLLAVLDPNRIPKPSLVASLDPRTKMIIMVMVVVAATQLSTVMELGILTALTILYGLLARLGRMFLYILVLSLGGLLSYTLLGWLGGGTDRFEHFLRAYLLRAIPLFTAGACFAATTSIPQFEEALLRLRLPRQIRYVVGVVLRFLPELALLWRIESAAGKTRLRSLIEELLLISFGTVDVLAEKVTQDQLALRDRSTLRLRLREAILILVASSALATTVIFAQLRALPPAPAQALASSQ